jgi:uncharacterized protein YqjF (DUF2071 family)
MQLQWIPNRLACLVGPAMYGLPYRLARNAYRCRTAPDRPGRCDGEVAAPGGRIAWRARVRPLRHVRPARLGLERFLLERYTAYTRRGATPLRFRVWHEPWLRVRARVALTDTSLLKAAFPWLGAGEPVAAHYSPGVRGVWIGPPRRVEPAAARGGRPARSEKSGVYKRAAAACRRALVKSFTRKPSDAPIGTTKGVA